MLRYIDGHASPRALIEQAHHRRLAAADQLPGLGCWAGFAEGIFVGLWFLHPPNGPDQREAAGEADLGYRLLRRYWRRGYASEGARELVRYGFDDVELERIFAQTMTVNAASRATLTSVGLHLVRASISAEPYDDPIPEADQGEGRIRDYPSRVATPPAFCARHHPGRAVAGAEQ